MAKILLLDFEESDYRYLLDRKFDVELKETNWKTGKIESLTPSEDCRIVFYQASLSDYGSGLHAGEAENFERIADEGGAIICFVGNCQEYHLTNIIGDILPLKFGENELPGKLTEVGETPFNILFSRFRAFISHASELLPLPSDLGKTLNLREWNPPFSGELEILARSQKNYPVAALLRRGKGFFLLLPWFGEKNIEVAELVLSKTLPGVSPHLTAGKDLSWLDSYDYFFPGLLEAYKQMEEESERHRQNMLGLEQKIEEIKAGEQEAFNKLLVAQGAELRQAVIRSLKYLEWLNVIDVDDYWKRVIRIKEEDIWLVDEDEKSVEELIRASQLILVSIKSGKGGAADEDCLLLQRYKGRRMQEFDNTNMKALLIGKYFSETEAKLREPAFSETQTAEAAKDGNGLLTTFELFKAIKAEKEKKITKETIRDQIKSKVGLITFDF